MNIIANIPGAIKMLSCLRHLQPDKKHIEAARAAGNYEEERKWILKSTTTWGNHVMDIFGSTVTVYGEENLPDQGPVVFVGNHQGYADIFSYFKAFQKFQFAFVAKKELGEIPLYGKWIARIRSVFIERDDPRASLEAINRGIEYIKEGFSLAIFPEGTRSKGPDPGEFQKGALKLATKPGVPIIPVSLNGSYKMFEEPGHLTSANIEMIVHKPIPTEGLSRKEEKALPDIVEKIIVDGVRKLQANEQGADHE